MQNRLSSNLVSLMNRHQIGGVELARAINIPLSTIKNIRKGVNINPTIETLLPVARYFNVSLEEIINDDLAIEKRNYKNDYSSKVISQAVPILSREEVITCCQHSDSGMYIFTEKLCSEHTFAIHSEQKVSELFAAPGVFLVDPAQKLTHFDYVLVCKLELSCISIKQFICDEDNYYLKSLVIANQLVPLNQNYKILGVVIEYRQFVK